ncbi:AraC family transcriptional regulator [Pseudomonas sp. N040]|uniref:AraC family transcriptional regulator n=1 Tax=Pseudomonas sp. N040 TaxID=2785325 RepID=UPI0018A29D0B|nr:AraC family transcriptional regulator [Pseudomonas sp. N040]MBF7731376.1 AraC family transcriptional regulator [Pseudomonas sp. N040]MBW7015019.1 helix-turn-helix domain-containing protein [Pseudomonas sp. N040]
MPAVIASSTPAVEVIEINDPAQANAGLELMEQDVMQLQTTPLHARQVIVRLGGSIVVYYTTNLRVRTRPTLHPNLIAYMSFAPQATGTADGLPVQADKLIIVPPDSRICLVADPDYASITLLLRPEDIRAHLQVRGRAEDFRLPTGVTTLDVDHSRAGSLFSWGKRLVELAEQQPELFNHNQEQRAAAHAELLEVLLESLALTRDHQPQRQERTRQVQSNIVRAAESYALAHADERLYVTDLCRAAAVSERTLEYAFRAVMGLSPTAYLTRLRLHRVHQALLVASPGATSVTQEALEWGFWHFGEFSRIYKKCFGELPSDTLRRPR